MAELLFIHGAGESAVVWERQLQFFGAQHSVLAVDLPGHGGRLAEKAFEDHAENAAEVEGQIRANALALPVVVGHSLGGAVALSLALRSPELPHALVLVASGARMRMHPRLLDMARGKAEAGVPGQPVGSLVPMDQAVAPEASAETRSWLAERLGQATAQATYADFLANDRFDVMDRLGEIKQPTLVIAGEADVMTPPRFQSFLAERLPNARLVLLPQAGHYVHVEQAETFDRGLSQFLDELGP